MKIRYSIRFNLIKLKDIEDDLRIRMRVSYDSKRINIPLSCRISLNKWDEDSESALPKYEDKFGNTSKDINREIDKYRSAMEKAFAKFELIDQKIPTPDELKHEFNEIAGKKTNEQKEETIFTNIQEVGKIFLKENRTLWSEGTYKKIKTILRHLKKFNANLEFSHIDNSFLKNYITFLIDKQGLQNTTVQKNVKTLKWFLNWSFYNKYNDNLEYKNFKTKLKTVEPKVIFLSWDELMLLYQLEIPDTKNYLDRVRDVFCFQCFTSLRYSDVFNLKRSDITENSIQLVTVKTNDCISIDLNDYSRSILDKYKDIPFPKNKALPVISNQKMNDYLKELGKLAELNTPETIIYYKGNERKEEVIPKHDLLSTHCGRRTFICNALAFGIPPHVVMKWTGHSDYKAMKPYIGVADETKSESMKKFNMPKEKLEVEETTDTNK